MKNATQKVSKASLTPQQDWNAPLTEDQRIRQLLNRITFGPRPGDVERVRQMGLNPFLREQLHPDKIDDFNAEARLAALPTLRMTTEELEEKYPPPRRALKREERRQASGDEMMEGQARVKAGSQPATSQGFGGEMQSRPGDDQMQGPYRVIMELAQQEVLRAVYSNRQLQEMMVQFWMNHFNIFAPKGADMWMTTSFERDTIRPRALGKFEDLLVATAKSPAMLFYLDNWLSSAPNSDANGFSGWLRRPGPFGGRGQWHHFGEADRTAQNPGLRRNKQGLNENYGRELMELHTLGVNGGYTQKDVTEVARCLTGWTIRRPAQGGEFYFDSRMHDYGEKVVLGHKIAAGRGMEDGLEVLHMLAAHPSTAHFISLKLCRRFVADDPPPPLVDRASQTFLGTQGDIRAVLEQILTSPEFYSQAAYRAKVKSPLEMAASTLRALGGQTDARPPLLQFIVRMGQPMFLYQAPTGFPDRASTWINSSSLLARMNFAMLVASNAISGTRLDLSGFQSAKAGSSREPVMRELAERLTGGELSPQTRAAILKGASAEVSPSFAASAAGLSGTSAAFSGGGPPAAGDAKSEGEISSVAALLIASPEFQRR